MNNNLPIWNAEVRDYEVDYQGIVNNANYFHYLDQARAKYLEHLGINLQEYANKKINIVLIKTEILFKKPLKYGNCFYVSSMLTRESKLKFHFDQTIFLQETKEIIVESQSLICCINTITGKPCVVPELENNPLPS